MWGILYTRLAKRGYKILDFITYFSSDFGKVVFSPHGGIYCFIKSDNKTSYKIIRNKRVGVFKICDADSVAMGIDLIERIEV